MRSSAAAKNYQKGLDFQADGDFRAAAAAFSVAVDLDPNDWEALTKRGDAYFMAGEIDRALRDFSAVLERRPDSLDALLGRATAAVNKASELAGSNRLLDMIDAYTTAQLDVDKALAINPRDRLALKLKVFLSEK